MLSLYPCAFLKMYSVERLTLPWATSSPLNLSPHELVSFSVLLWLFFISVPVFFALVTGADYVGLSCFGPHAVCGQGQLWPSHSEHGQSRAREPLMWERQAGEIEWEENQPFGASKMIRFSTGVKVCSVSESPSPCSPSMSPMFSQDISLMLGRKYLVHTSECKESIFWFFIQLQIHMSTSELLGVLFWYKGNLMPKILNEEKKDFLFLFLHERNPWIFQWIWLVLLNVLFCLWWTQNNKINPAATFLQEKHNWVLEKPGVCFTLIKSHWNGGLAKALLRLFHVHKKYYLWHAIQRKLSVRQAKISLNSALAVYFSSN